MTGSIPHCVSQILFRTATFRFSPTKINNQTQTRLLCRLKCSFDCCNSDFSAILCWSVTDISVGLNLMRWVFSCGLMPGWDWQRGLYFNMRFWSDVINCEKSSLHTGYKFVFSTPLLLYTQSVIFLESPINPFSRSCWITSYFHHQIRFL